MVFASMPSELGQESADSDWLMSRAVDTSAMLVEGKTRKMTLFGPVRVQVATLELQAAT
jgi:hypothetical protein